MKNKLLIHVTTWMNVIDFTLKKRKLAEKITYVLYVVPFILRTETIDTTSKKITSEQMLAFERWGLTVLSSRKFLM